VSLFEEEEGEEEEERCKQVELFQVLSKLDKCTSLLLPEVNIRDLSPILEENGRRERSPSLES
jgi:hypothetical protein